MLEGVALIAILLVRHLYQIRNTAGEQAAEIRGQLLDGTPKWPRGDTLNGSISVAGYTSWHELHVFVHVPAVISYASEYPSA